MISIASSAVTLLQLIIVCYIPSKGVYALTHLTSRSLSSPCRGAVSTPLSSAVFTFLTSLNSRRGHGDENFNYRISSVVTESAALKADSYRALHHSTYVGYVVGENRVQAVENGNVARSKSGYVEFQGKSRFQRVSATRACSRQRSDHKAHSVSRLYSSAVEDVIAQNREAKAVKSLDDDQPIILFHSVICGSSGAISSSGGTVSHNGQEVKPLKKTPIIVLHGLLGSARNFQSWMKLLQQREVELVREDEEKREQEVCL